MRSVVQREEAEKTMERNRRYAAFLQHQMSRKEAKAQAAVDGEFEEDLARQYVVADNDEVFEQYAKAHIDEWARQGKPTTPMHLIMKRLRRQPLAGNSR